MPLGLRRVDWQRVRPRRWLLALYVLAIAVVTVQRGVLHPENNFAIYRSAFFNLVAGRDLYAAHPEQYADLFKYSPTFALLFAPFALPPFAVGLLLWNALNALLLWAAIERLLPSPRASLVLALIAAEVVHQMQRAQSNALAAALMILAFVAYERRRPAPAAGAVALGTAIKLFPVAALSLIAFHPRRVRAALLAVAALGAAAVLPLVVMSPAALLAQYRSWGAVEAADAAAGPATAGGGALYGGVMGQLRIWFGVHWPNWPVQLLGTMLVVLPLALRRDRWAEAGFRLRYLCSLLVYVVVFNHQAESPSFVIAVTGIAIWFAAFPRTRVRTAITALTLAVVSVAYSVVPPWLYSGVLVHYRLKTLPCLVAWAAIQWELLSFPARAPMQTRAHGQALAACGDG